MLAVSHLHMGSSPFPVILSSSIQFQNQIRTSQIFSPDRNRFRRAKFSGENNSAVEVEAEDKDEYDTVWETKPSWCQPWTITLTGISIISLSWLSFRSVALTSAAAALIFLWWYAFLYSYPKAYSEMIAERRKKTKDTYGHGGTGAGAD